MKTYVVLKCLHGSCLYGLNTPQSDQDFYEIYDLPYQYRPKRQIKQTIVEDIDTVRISVEKFEEQCLKGVPQSVEVLFAPPGAYVDVTAQWHNIRTNIQNKLVNNMPAVIDTYRRTALNFSKGDAKRRRHGFRLLLNIRDLIQTGQMCSRLTAEQVSLVNILTVEYDSSEKFKDLFFDTFG